MYWPTQSGSVPLTELGWVNTTYLSGGSTRFDPTIVWGTTVETEALDDFLASQRRSSGLILSAAHVLVRAVAEGLHRHPELNRRIIGRRVYQYSGVNVVIPMLQTRGGEVDVVFLRNVERLSVAEIAGRLWEEARQKALDSASEVRRRRDGTRIGNLLVALARRVRLEWIHAMSGVGFAIWNRLRLPTVWAWHQELNGAGAFVNYLGFPGAPPMISYKPSCLPTNSFSVSVTMGPAEPRAVAVNNALVIRRQAPLFVRVDHRMVNGHQFAAFVTTLRSLLANPGTLVESQTPGEARAA